MKTLDPWYEAREVMRGAIAADLLGGPADDLLAEAPLDRFIVGILHPRSAPIPAETAVEEATGADRPATLAEEVDQPEAASDSPADAVFDPAVALSRVRYPSSMGLTFAVDVRDTSSVTVSARAARYVEIEADRGTSAPAQESVRHLRGGGRTGTRWQRAEPVLPDNTIDVATPRSYALQLADGLDLHVVVRRPVRNLVSVTTVLINTLVHSTGPKDGLCWFQPSLRLGTSGAFVDRPAARPAGVDDDDLDSYDLLFRDVRNLAVGHGCAVDWSDADSVTHLSTTFLPHYDLRLSEARSAAGLSMSQFAETGDLGPLDDLIASYQEWIKDRREETRDLDGDLLATAGRHLDEATDAAGRMGAGVQLLRTDEGAMRAFRLMNRAMSEQRLRQERVRAQDAGRAAEDQDQSWRPFQIAFILINLPGLTDPHSPERELADLLWFPTGGGKTEAYLGLIGYAILLRRIRDSAHGGVSVLMRYTLRLLTLQQFERAAGLICALESIRRRHLAESEPVSLGLWVGQGGAPNTVKEAKKALRRLARGEEAEEGNPVQLLRCPWCGRSLRHEDYVIDPAATRMTVRCGDPECDYRDGLPVHLVDDDVYRERPSLVIGTVDKFAMMAWRAQVSSLFSTDGAHPPPDLIVQDELHLISGPLGTMVGLYETAVDAACTREARPKVVASTATIRRARKQVKAVFDRDSRQFPPPGLTADDSYFAVEASAEAKGTRQYVGVLAPGVSQATLLVRTYAALLQAAKDLDVDDAVKDAYWTLLGYFNSLRLLGGAFMQVIDDVPDRLKVVAERGGGDLRELAEPRELTSRKKSSEIPTELAILGTSLPSEQCPDVVLATNMISVGVDVDRLGLMAVMGQPQTTAEYIQATSRVGRRHPGLVVVMYNGARSRDLSHYESFSSYHRSLYRQVEATGATPFAARARDRGLHGVLVALARMLVPAARPDGAAGDVRTFEDQVRSKARILVERARNVTGDVDEVEAVERQLEALVDAWSDAGGRQLKYPGWFDSDALLVPAGRTTGQEEEWTFPVDDPPWPTLSSLRDVDAESWVYLIPSKKRES